MAADPALAIDPRFPNLRPEVVAGYLHAPETMVAEVLDGELSLMPRPRPRHAHATGELHSEIHGPFQRGRGGAGGWVFLIEPELHLGSRPDIVIPDLAGWHRDRFPEDAFDDETTVIKVAPDWVSEVISPRTETNDRGKKMRIYRREGVGHLWYVSPASQTVEVYELTDKHYMLLDTYDGDDAMRAPPFDALEIPLSVLWKL